MYGIKKRLEIAGAHMLNLDYESKCSEMHGHNWIVTIHCERDELDRNGMVVDFTEIKRLVSDRFDHKCINNVISPLNPTAENMAKFICDSLEQYGCYMVEVQESEGNTAWYSKEVWQ